MSEDDQIILRNYLVFDSKDRVVDFDYEDIRSKLSEEEYNNFLSTILNSNKFEIDDKLISISNNPKAIRKSFVNLKSGGDEDDSYGVDGEEGCSHQRIYHDKRNWRRPGCKRSIGSICVIYIEVS